jgi:hypothetical protein
MSFAFSKEIDVHSEREKLQGSVIEMEFADHNAWECASDRLAVSCHSRPSAHEADSFLVDR